MLSDEDIAIATNKGWTISPAKSINEPVVVTTTTGFAHMAYQVNSKLYDYSQLTATNGTSPTPYRMAYFEGNLNSLTVANGMFMNRDNLIEVNITNFHPTSMYNTFKGCYKLEYIDVSD